MIIFLFKGIWYLNAVNWQAMTWTLRLMMSFLLRANEKAPLPIIRYIYKMRALDLFHYPNSDHIAPMWLSKESENETYTLLQYVAKRFFYLARYGLAYVCGNSVTIILLPPRPIIFSNIAFKIWFFLSR